jgi:predicted DNA-binding transcriptional regulator AlpA
MKLSRTVCAMKFLSTRQAAKKLGLSPTALSTYVLRKKVPSPKPQRVGGQLVYAWTEADIEKVREILPKIANGRKTRYQKERAKKKSQSKGPKGTSKKK